MSLARFSASDSLNAFTPGAAFGRGEMGRSNPRRRTGRMHRTHARILLQSDEPTTANDAPNFVGAIVKPVRPEQMARIVQFCLREDLRGKPDIEKTVARAANANVEAARNWLGGRNAPNSATMFNLATAKDQDDKPLFPTLRFYACQLLEVPNDGFAEHDADFQRAMAAAAAAYWSGRRR